jgi:hypothetical protein
MEINSNKFNKIKTALNDMRDDLNTITQVKKIFYKDK